MASVAPRRDVHEDQLNNLRTFYQKAPQVQGEYGTFNPLRASLIASSSYESMGSPEDSTRLAISYLNRVKDVKLAPPIKLESLQLSLSLIQNLEEEEKRAVAAKKRREEEEAEKQKQLSRKRKSASLSPPSSPQVRPRKRARTTLGREVEDGEISLKKKARKRESVRQQPAHDPFSVSPQRANMGSVQKEKRGREALEESGKVITPPDLSKQAKLLHEEGKKLKHLADHSEEDVLLRWVYYLQAGLKFLEEGVLYEQEEKSLKSAIGLYGGVGDMFNHVGGRAKKRYFRYLGYLARAVTLARRLRLGRRELAEMATKVVKKKDHVLAQTYVTRTEDVFKIFEAAEKAKELRPPDVSPFPQSPWETDLATFITYVREELDKNVS